MRICLIGKPNEHERFKDYATDLRSLGFKVVSCWHESARVYDFVVAESEQAAVDKI